MHLAPNQRHFQSTCELVDTPTLCTLTFEEASLSSDVASTTNWRRCLMSPAISEVLTKTETLTEPTVSEARRVLAGRRSGLRGSLAFVGPAVIVSIAYMDPGNFATNIQAGAKY